MQGFDGLSMSRTATLIPSERFERLQLSDEPATDNSKYSIAEKILRAGNIKKHEMF
jgi:hypothetical protein